MIRCQECHHAFRSARAALRAQSEGCPRCGGTDIDESLPPPPAVPRETRPTVPSMPAVLV